MLSFSPPYTCEGEGWGEEAFLAEGSRDVWFGGTFFKI
jgi:hypothetical protein